jgi:hypothetical protein
MAKSFKVSANMLQIPASEGLAITPSDSVELDEWTRGIYVGTGGDLKVTLTAGQVVTFKNLAGGIVHPICARLVWATDTTASDIVGLY